MRVKDGITIEDDGESVTITVQGSAYENAQKIAAVMNAVSWTDNDHNISWVFRWWILPLVESLAETPATCPFDNATEITGQIVNGIDTGFKSGTSEDKARRAELADAFNAAFGIEG